MVKNSQCQGIGAKDTDGNGIVDFGEFAQHATQSPQK
jgi:hypothetical protein